MIRPALAAILMMALWMPARADIRDGTRAAAVPMTLDRLRDVLARDQEQENARGGGPDAAAGLLPGGPALWPRRDGARARAAEAYLLPDRCYDAVHTARGTVAGYQVGCMRAAVARPGSLPPHCLAQVRDTRAPRILYDARCLRSQGWTSRAARR